MWNLVQYTFLYAIIRYEKPIESDLKILVEKKLIAMYEKKQDPKNQEERKLAEYRKLAN